MIQGIALRDVLPPGLEYLIDLSAAKGIDVKLAMHPCETTTCKEKAKLLNWSDEQVIKALYFTRDGSLEFGVVMPEIGRHIDTKEVAAMLGTTNSQAKRFRNSYAPPGMSHGTCTPFIHPRVQHDLVKGLYFDEAYMERLGERPADFSIGLVREPYTGLSKRLSVQLPYKAAYEIVKEAFPGHVHSRRIF